MDKETKFTVIAVTVGPSDDARIWSQTFQSMRAAEEATKYLTEIREYLAISPTIIQH